MSLGSYLAGRRSYNFKREPDQHDPYATRHGEIHSEGTLAPSPAYHTASETASLVNGRVEWKETETEHVFRVELPGMKKEEVTVDLEGNRVLKITGERWVEREDKADPWHRVERTCTRVVRSVRLPDDSKPHLTKACMENGVLTINVPREEMRMNRHGVSTRIPIY